jgi:hypothetical protein
MTGNCSIFLFYKRKGEIPYQGLNNSSSKEADTLNLVLNLMSNVLDIAI